MWHLWQQKEKNSCNARVRVRARERVISVILHFEILAYALRVALRFHHIRMCTKNNTSLWRKQHVVLMKTTRHFEENKPSFCENKPSLWRKRHVTLKKTSQRFIQKSPLMETKKKSSRHNLHKYKHKEDYWSTKAKELCKKWKKRGRKTKKKQWGYCKAKKAFIPYLPKKSLLKWPNWRV